MIFKPQLIKIKQINKIRQNHSSDILPQLIKTHTDFGKFNFLKVITFTKAKE